MRTRKTSLIPTSVVAVFEDFSSLCQFRGVWMFSRCGEYVWSERSDGKLATEAIATIGRNGQPATYALVIDRERRVMTSTQHESDGSVVISHNMAHQIGDGSEWCRQPGDVDRRFDELVDMVLDLIEGREIT